MNNPVEAFYAESRALGEVVRGLPKLPFVVDYSDYDLYKVNFQDGNPGVIKYYLHDSLICINSGDYKDDWEFTLYGKTVMEQQLKKAFKIWLKNI